MRLMRPIIANISKSNPRISRVSWGGIVAGAFTMVSILFTLNLLGLGIGLTVVDSNAAGSQLSNIGTGTIIWWSVSNLIAIFIGGMVAARMAGYSSSTDGGLHGFIAWSVYTVFTFIIFSSAIGSLFTGLDRKSGTGFNNRGDLTISHQLDRAERRLQDRVNTTYNQAKRGYYQLMNPTNRPNYDLSNMALDNRSEEKRTDEDRNDGDENSSRENLSTLFPGQMYGSQNVNLYFNDLEIQGDREKGYEVRPTGNRDYFDEEYLKDNLVNRTSMSEGEIDQMLTHWRQGIDENITLAEQQYRETQAEVTEKRKAMADAAGKYGIILFVLLGIGALAGFFGGALGAPELFVSEEHREELIEENKPL